MGGGARRQRVEIISPFKDRNHAAFGLVPGDGGDFAGDPGKVRFGKLKPAKGVCAMGVKAGGNDDEIRIEVR